MPAVDHDAEARDLAGVDAVRLWLDGMLRAATDAVRGLSGQEPPAG